MTERWGSVLGYEGLYEVSDLGDVKSLKRFRIGPAGRPTRVKERIKSQSTSLPYNTVALSRGSRQQRTLYVHRLVWEAFVGPIPIGYEINHINSNKRDNRLVNLEAITKKDNVLHAIKAGKSPHMTPGNTPGTKLTMSLARDIRKRIARGERQCEIADDLSVCRQTITLIKQNRIWVE